MFIFYTFQNTQPILLETQELKAVVDNHLHSNLNTFLNVPPPSNPLPSSLPFSLSSPSSAVQHNAIFEGSMDMVQRQLQHQLNERAVTATPKPSTTNLNDIFITVKTTKMYHDTRLALIIKTWFQLAKEQVSHRQSTKLSTKWNVWALCCKTYNWEKKQKRPKMELQLWSTA